MFLLRLTQNVVGKWVPFEQLHDYVHIFSICKGVEVAYNIWVVQVFQDGNFFTNFLHQYVINWNLHLVLLNILHCQIFLKLLRGHIKMCQWNLFHCILILSSLHLIDWTVGPFSNKVLNFESIDIAVFSFSCDPLKISHLLKVVTDGSQRFVCRFLIQSFQQRNVGLKFFVVISNIDKCAKKTRWEDNFESLAILFNRVQKAETSETVQLQFVLNLYICGAVRRVGNQLYIFAL